MLEFAVVSPAEEGKCKGREEEIPAAVVDIVRSRDVGGKFEEEEVGVGLLELGLLAVIVTEESEVMLLLCRRVWVCLVVIEGGLVVPTSEQPEADCKRGTKKDLIISTALIEARGH